MSEIIFSVIIPIYNRPHEVAELLESLTHQTFKAFEVLLVEDGSSITSQKVYEDYAGKLALSYFFKPNSGPGPSRNFGFERAMGKYLVVFDSDCIIPPDYFEIVNQFLLKEKVDAWGGPDRSMKEFTSLQQAMAFTMSSLLTTGGIRGKNKKGFQPRSFNMGISREVFEKTNGFQFSRYAEDIELSIRIRKAGFKTSLIEEAFVYHKRRTSLSQFFNQVSNFGKGRVLVGQKHPGEIKLTHWFPAFLLLGMVAMPISFFINYQLSFAILAAYLLYTLAVTIDCFLSTRSLVVAIRCVPSLWVQMVGYGYGFLSTMLQSTSKHN
jgi:glycosyltransferase involved in cell wall biosynthesis